MQLTEIMIFPIAKEETGKLGCVLGSELFSLGRYTLGDLFGVIVLENRISCEHPHCPVSFKITFLMNHSVQCRGYPRTYNMLVGITFEYSNKKNDLQKEEISLAIKVYFIKQQIGNVPRILM